MMTVQFIASAVIAALLLTGPLHSAPQNPPPGNAATKVTAEQAETIALTHAGLMAEEVTELRSHPDRDGRVRHMDVDFRVGDWEYDYEISLTGTVLEWEKEYEPVKIKPPATTVAPAQLEAPPVTEPAPAQPKKLTAEEAKALALAHAGLAEDQVTHLRVEFDYDDGIPEYEVEFMADGWEYEYEIHGETGRILSWDKDWDD